MDAYAKYKEENQPKKKTVLIAPSWGNENVLETCGDEIVRILLNAGYRVIVRPHSETIKRSPDLIERIEKEFSGNLEFSLEKSNASDRSMIVADVLISDCSGITLEYAFGTLRPVLFIDVPLKIKNARYQELGLEPLEISLRQKIGKIISARDIAALPETVRELIDNGEVYRESIGDLRTKWVFNLGNSSKIGADYISRL
jgi:YidC/Oxa1 family membrane protein insertase